MLLRQMIDADLGCASYLVGDDNSGEAVLVDPAYAIEPLLEEANRAGLRVTRVLETHTHADHVSGHGRLALDHGIPVSIHRDAAVAYRHDGLADGDEIEVGSLRILTLHTPGHRPEHCCFLVGDVLLTGDSLFVGSAARPDLAVEARTGAEGLFHSLHRLLELPDDVRVMPGHVAGSLCGAHMSPELSSTIGRERTRNPAFTFTTVEAFVAESAAIETPRPPNMERIVELNRGPFLGSAGALGPASLEGNFVLDVRDFDRFAAGHVRSAVNVPVTGSSFGTKAGFLVPHAARIAVHAETEPQAQEAAARLRAVGFFDIAGYLEDPPAEATLEQMSLDRLRTLLDADAISLVDVREPDEWAVAHIPGSTNIPYRIVADLAPSLPAGRPIVTVCETGPRAAIAASVLAARGVSAAAVAHGGVNDWADGGGPLARSAVREPARI